MGRVVKGILKGISGKIGDVVVNQQKDGSVTVQGAPKPRRTPFSEAELAGQKPAKIWNAFLKPIKDFIDVGWELQAKHQKQNQNNVMVRHLCSAALVREGKEPRIVYSKLLVTKGKMLPPQNAAVEVVDAGILITWNKEISFDGQHYSDRIMVLAYFTGQFQALETTGGAERHEGAHLLALRGIERGTAAEVWVSFIKKNRKDISDSVYLGQIQC